MAGVFAVALRKNLRTLVGDEAFAQTLARLSDEHREELEATTSLGWAKLDMVDAVVDTAAEVSGRDPLELNADITRLNMKQTIHGVWRLLLKAATDRMIIQRTPSLYSRAYNRGHVTSEWIGPGHATVTLTQWPDLPEYALSGGAVAIETLLEHAGRSGVGVSMERTQDGARLRIRWS